jgi:hypothetical protein
MSCPCTAQKRPPLGRAVSVRSRGQSGDGRGSDRRREADHSNSDPPELKESIRANRNHVVVMFAAKAQTDDPGDRKKPQ